MTPDQIAKRLAELQELAKQHESILLQISGAIQEYNRKNDANLKPPAPNPKTKADAGRKASFCARMEGVVKHAKGPAERAKASLKNWNC